MLRVFLLLSFAIECLSSPLQCYSGLRSGYQNILGGGRISCDGQCASFSGYVNGYLTKSYKCVPNQICDALNLNNNCKPLVDDGQVTACCCNNADFCNIKNTGITPPPPPVNEGFTVACYNGLYVNGVPETPLVLGACQGQCSTISFNNTIDETGVTMTYYGCDPNLACQQFQLSNGCKDWSPGTRQCCCDTDLCLDPVKNKTDPVPLNKCFSGVYAKGVGVGAEMLCSGSCFSVAGVVNKDTVTVFGCMDTSFCRQLQIYNECGTNTDITTCCCDSHKNCNVELAGLEGKIDVSKPVGNLHDYQISCFNGLYFNSSPLSATGWQSCQGFCSSFTFSNITVYSCTPDATCYQLGLSNNCTEIEPGLTGCCCSTDACLDPTTSPARSPGPPLKCYVGFESSYPFSVGAETYCNGQCASISGFVAGFNVTSYHCVPDTVCKSMQIRDACRSLNGDREIKFCCCNNVDHCNVKNSNVKPPTQIGTDAPIVCYSGLLVNGVPLSAVTLDVCHGQCSSIEYSTAFQGERHTTKLYGCNPSTICENLNAENSCSALEPGVVECCCGTNACMNPNQ